VAYQLALRVPVHRKLNRFAAYYNQRRVHAGLNGRTPFERCGTSAFQLVDRMDALDRPAERHGSIAQRVLTLRALGVLQYLARSGLPQEEGVAAQVFRATFR
jgi:hypothetical protein